MMVEESSRQRSRKKESSKLSTHNFSNVLFEILCVSVLKTPLKLTDHKMIKKCMNTHTILPKEQ